MIELDRHAPLTFTIADSGEFYAVYAAYDDGFVEVLYPLGARRFSYITEDDEPARHYSVTRLGGWRASFTLRVVEGSGGSVAVTDSTYEVVDG